MDGKSRDLESSEKIEINQIVGPPGLEPGTTGISA